MIRMALRSFNIQMYCLLGIMLLGWLVTPFSAQFVGISIGLLVSMYCAWILGRRIEKFGDSIVKSKSTDAWNDKSVRVPILGAIIMYEIEHHEFMWTFVCWNYEWVFLGYY